MFDDMFKMFADTFKSMTITEFLKYTLDFIVAFGAVAIIGIIAALL